MPDDLRTALEIKSAQSMDDDFLWRGPDPKAVSDYFDLPDTETVFARAVAMMPKDETNPGAAVQLGMETYIQSEAWLNKQRESMVGSMSYLTLLLLLERLNITDPFAANSENDQNLKDPHIGPPLRRLQGLQTPAASKNRIHIGINLPEKENVAATNLRPALPCSLKDALLYAANTDEKNWHAVNKAFEDFTIVFKTLSQEQQTSQSEEAFRCREQENSKTLTKLSLGKRPSAETIEQKTAFEKDQETVRECLRALKAIKEFRRDFQPGKAAPVSKNQEAALICSNYWRSPTEIRFSPLLEWLSIDFRKFWITHHKDYLKLESKRAKSERNLSKSNSKAARNAATNREQGRWDAVLDDFIKHLENAGSKLSNDNLTRLIKKFVSTHQKQLGSTAIKNMDYFLSSLCVGTLNNFKTNIILEMLREIKLREFENADEKKRVKMIKSLGDYDRNRLIDQNLIPEKWIMFKTLTEDSVSSFSNRIKPHVSNPIA